MPRTIQTNEETSRNLAEALKNLKASITLTPDDALILDRYLEKNFTENGLSDYSPANIQAALWHLREVLAFTTKPVAPRTPNSQSILNESNRDRRAREAAEAEARAAQAKLDEAEATTKEALRQGERICNLAGTNAAVSHASRARAKERMWEKWNALQKIAPPATAVKLLQAYWESDQGQSELYSSVGIMRRLQS